MKLKKIGAAIMAASLMSSTALAHTNSVGYVGDGTGNITVWYGSWHDGTTFNEAELKVLDANDAKITQTQFNLLSQDSPAGLISGVNYFGSDGTQLINYDVNTGGGESYTWQGATFQLRPGDYTFVYIPLQDAESTLCPAGTSGCGPTMDWVPMDEIIRSLSVTLTQNDINGDANGNNILDINEVGVGDAAAAASGPTVVSQGSSTVIGYVAASGGVIQIVSRTQTDTTWDNMSDGTTQNTQVSTTELTPFEGRVDQIATAQDVVGSTLRNLDFDNIEGIRMNSKMKNGMTGSTKGAVVGGSKELENGVTISGGFTRLGTDLSGNDDTVKADTDVFAFGVERDNVQLEVRRANTDYTTTRTIGDFANESETKGADTSVAITYAPDTGKINPVFGYTRGKRTVDGYTETGSIQTARTVADSSEMYGYGTVGLRGDLGLVDFTAMHHTDGVNDISIGLEKDTGDVTWRIETTRSMTDLGNTNAISAGLVIKF
jgi:hypothetical protein